MNVRMCCIRGDGVLILGVPGSNWYSDLEDRLDDFPDPDPDRDFPPLDLDFLDFEEEAVGDCILCVL
jgi:hypothetical protein